MQTKRFRAVMILVIVLMGCSSPPMQPVLNNQRHLLTIVSSCDSTAEFQLLTSQFITLVAKYLDSDFVETMERYPTDMESMIRTYPNPFRLVSAESTQYRDLTARITIATIDTESYSALAFFMWSLPLNKPWNTPYINTHVHYRIHVTDASQNPIDSFEVIGISSGDVRYVTQDTLKLEANAVAAFKFAGLLVKHLDEVYKWNIKSRLSYLNRKKHHKIKNLYRQE